MLEASVVLLAICLLGGATAPGVHALSDADELATFGGIGEGAGQLKIPGDVGVDPVTGHVLTAEVGNNRVSEFTAWGKFVRAFGWDVAPGSVNERQELRVSGTGGEFRLALGGVESGPLTLSSSAAEVQSAAESLAGIGNGNVLVEEVPGNPDGSTPYIFNLTFKGSLAAVNVGQVTVNTTAITLTSIARTVANGGAAGTGLEACTTESGCQKGSKGSAPGQMAPFSGVGVDSAGDIYLREEGNNRVQEFDSAGGFKLMFGDEVNKTTGGDVCTKENVEVDHDICGAGIAGTAPGQLTSQPGLAVSPSGSVYVSVANRIDVYGSTGVFQNSLPLTGEASDLFYDSATPSLVVALPAQESVVVLSTTGQQQASCTVTGLGSVVGDDAGNLFAAHLEPASGGRSWVIELDSSCNQLGTLAETSKLSSGNFFGLNGLGLNGVGDLYVSNVAPSVDSFIREFGPAPLAYEGPPPVAPTISAQSPSEVGSTSATIAPLINPHFWTDTHYYVEYGLSPCKSGGCTQLAPTPPGDLLTTKPVNASLRGLGIVLSGLEPHQTYFFRVVAQSGGGGPVRGVGGTEAVDGSESSFRTFPATVAPKVDCPNQGFRVGHAADLPDCRAYEMVSPIDKNNGDIESEVDITGFLTNLSQSSLDGNRVTYSSYRSFGEAAGAPFTNQYVASRNPAAGWSSEPISAPVSPAGLKFFNLEAQAKAFSPSLCASWLVTIAEPPFAPEATKGLMNLYQRENCTPGGAFKALINVDPGVSRPKSVPEIQGFAADGASAVFRLPAKLTSDATAGVLQTYVAGASGLQFACVLPNGTPWADSCSAGSNANGLSGEALPDLDRYGSVLHAMSSDGSRLYWTASHEQPSEESLTLQSGAGRLFLRINPSQPQSTIVSGQCSEPELACTIPVSETVTTKSVRFLAASPDGSRALFIVSEGPKQGTLYRFDIDEGTVALAGKVLGVAGSGEGLSTVYFISEEHLGGKGTAGKPNLYSWSDGSATFIATLSPEDAVNTGLIPSDANPAPVYHAASASADGQALVFISTASLTGYDNTDATSAKACADGGQCDSEVYVYRVGSSGPVCISCNPSGAQPLGRVMQGVANSPRSLATAAFVPAPNYQLSPQQSITDTGKTVFFNSFDSLVPRDRNGKQDVYEWTQAASETECTAAGQELYVEEASGCLSLISSGESPVDSEFQSASPSGADVFFSTDESLIPQDPGQVDIYDAREFGGFPSPQVATPPCRGEGCQPEVAPPPNAPVGSNERGKGNPKPACKKGQRKVKRHGKVRCVSQKRHKGKAKEKSHQHRHAAVKMMRGGGK